MASTYENDLRLEEMATGENSGSWGTKTNTNLELIADAFSYGTETIANADTTITIADGAADAARSLALKINSSEDLTTTRVVTLAPNTTSKVWIIENNTSGGQTLTISAGSGTNITLLNGQTKIIATDGIGAGSNVVELTQDIAIADLFIDDDLSMQSDGAIINFGADADITLTHAADTSLTLGGAGTTTGLVVNNTATDGDPILGFALSGTNTFTMGVDDGDSDKFKIGTSAIGTDTRLTIDSAGFIGAGESTPLVPLHVKNSSTNNSRFESTDAGAANGPIIDLYRNSASPLSGDGLGLIYFKGEDSAGNATNYAQIRAEIRDANNGTEDGLLSLRTIVAGTDTARINIAEAETNVNESGADLDFRVESDSNSNMLFVDAGENAVKIGGTTTREGALQVFTSGGGVAAEIESTNGGSGQGPILQLRRTSSTPAGNDYLGGLNFVGQDSGNNALSYVDMYTRATTVTDGSEESQFSIRTRRNGNLEERVTIDAVQTTFNEASADADFRVESDSNTHMLFVDAGNNHVNIGGTGTDHGGLLNMDAPDGSFIVMNGTSNNKGFINWESNGFTFYTNGPQESLRLGSSEMVVNEDSRDYDFRVESNSNTHLLFIDGGNNEIGINDSAPPSKVSIVGGGSTSSTLELCGTTNDASKNDNATISAPFSLILNVNNQTAGDQSGRDVIIRDGGQGYQGGTEIARFGLDESVINGEGQDQDFRVESDTDTHAIFVDAENNRVNIHASSGENLINMNAAGVSSHTSGTLPPGLTLYNSNTGNGTGNAITWKDATGAQGIAGIASFRNSNAGGYARDLRFYVNNSAATNAFQERLRIDRDGNVMMGNTLDFPSSGFRTASGFRFRQAGDANYLEQIRTTTSDSSANFYMGNNLSGYRFFSFNNNTSQIGSISNSGNNSVSYNTTSDYRLKENVEDIADGITRVKQLQPKRFSWISEEVDVPTVDGFIAHEAQTVVPEAVHGTHNEVDDDGNPVYQGIDQAKLVPLLTAALQEAIAKIETLEARIAALETP